MLRRGLVQLMAFLLVALPLLGVLPNDTHAASSRIAVIKEMSGDVKVKKSGGSKAFRAFAKLSLKQGDILTTGEDGEATLIFSNGSSSDDSMTVSSDTTLTFSKLSSKGGSVTKVSMLKGSVWSDVKSIKTKNDEFQLETPTAVMGVRGTDFFTTVSSLTGSTDMFVFAGVVQAALSSFPFPGSGESNEQLSLVYPAQQIFLPGLTSLMSPLVTYADLNSIIEHATDSLIKAMLLSKEKIDQENQDLIDKLKLDGNIPPELIGLDPSIGLDPTDYIQKLESLLSSAVQGAVDSNKITDQDLARLIEQVNQDMGTPVELSDEKYELSQNQKQKLEELRKKQLEEQQAALEKKKQQVNDALYSMIQQLRQNMQNLNSINQALLEKLQKQTESKLTSGMSDAEKAAYEAAKSQNQGTPPATTQPSTTPSQSNNSLLDQLELTGAELSPAFDAATTAYETSVANGVSELEVKASAQDARASVQVNETALTDAGLLVPLNVGSNEISVVVTAENGSKTTYTIAVTRAEAPPSGTSTLSSLTLSSGTLSPAFAPDVASYTTSVSSGTESVTVTPVATDENATVTVDGENLTDGSRTVALNYGDNTIQIKVTAEDGQTQKVYTVQAVRQLINQVDIQFPAGSPVSIDFTSSNPSQEINVPSDADSLDLKVPGDGPSLTITANGTEITPEPVYVAAVASLPDPVAWSYHIPLTAGVNTIEVTALIDGLSKTYTIIANKPLPSDTGLTSLQVVETGGSMTYDAAADGDTWSVRVPASWTAASLKFVPADPSAKLVLNDQEYASGDLVPLTLTADGVSFQMKAADGTLQAYTLNIQREVAPKSNVATLSSLQVNEQSLTPGFTSGNTEYGIIVSGDTTSLNVAYEPTDPLASAVLQLNGSNEGVTGSTVELSNGQNVIEVIVTAEDGETVKTYQIAIQRKSTDATLSSLTITDQEGSEPYEFDTPFNPQAREYSVEVPSEMTILKVAYDLASESASAVMRLNGDSSGIGADGQTVTLSNGINDITIVVTPEDGEPQTYTISVFKPSDIPESLLNWESVTDTNREMSWRLEQHEIDGETFDQYAAQTDGAATRFDLSVEFDTSLYSHIELSRFDLEGGDNQEPIRLDNGSTTPINLDLGGAYSFYTMDFIGLDGESQNVKGLVVLRGNPPSDVLSMDALMLLDIQNSKKYQAVQVSAEGDYFAGVDGSAGELNVFPALTDSPLYLFMDYKLYDDERHRVEGPLELAQGNNTFYVSIRDPSQLFQREYKLIIYKGDIPAGLELTLSSSDGTIVPWNNEEEQYDLFVDHEATTVPVVIPSTGAGTSVRVFGAGQEISSSGGSYRIPAVGDNTVYGIVVQQGDQRWAYPVVVHRAQVPPATDQISAVELHSLSGSNLSLSYMQNVEGPGTYFTVVDPTLSEATLVLNVAPTVQSVSRWTEENGYEYFTPDTNGQVVIPLQNLSDGVNRSQIDVTGENHEKFYVDLIRGGIPLWFMNIGTPDQTNISAIQTGVNSYYAAIGSSEDLLSIDAGAPNSNDISVYVDGIKQESTDNVQVASEGWHKIELAVSSYGRQVATTYTLWLWKGDQIPSPSVNWNLASGDQSVQVADNQATVPAGDGEVTLVPNPTLPFQAVYVENEEIHPDTDGNYKFELNPVVQGSSTTQVYGVVDDGEGHLIACPLVINWVVPPPL